MAKKTAKKAHESRVGRVLVTPLMGARDLETPEQRKAVAGDLADIVVEAVQAERRRQGLPPLE
jgi:hypothetical protein